MRAGHETKLAPPPKRGRFRFGLKTLFAFTAVCAVAAWYLSGYMPGTLDFDESGIPHGTGTKRYFYEAGALKLEETYLAGNLQTSHWYHPNGSLIAETRWKAGSATGIYLLEDG